MEILVSAGSGALVCLSVWIALGTHLANLAFTSIKIGQGKHTVTLKYIDSTYRLGLALFFAASAILLAVKIYPLIVSYICKGKNAKRD